VSGQCNRVKLGSVRQDSGVPTLKSETTKLVSIAQRAHLVTDAELPYERGETGRLKFNSLGSSTTLYARDNKRSRFLANLDRS